MKRKEVEKSIHRHIRITDMEMLDMIDQIMEYPEFNSFNKVINEALWIALPKILDRLEGREEITLGEAEPYNVPQSQATEEEFYAVVVQLLKEIVMNVVINKSILSSLFHGKRLEYKDCKVDIDSFENGLFSDTPDYLVDFETEMIKKMRQ